MTIAELLKHAEQLGDSGRPVPMLQALEQVRAVTRVPAYRLLSTYNIGVVTWDKLGDGIQAREAFMQAADLHGPEYSAPQLIVLRAGALENLVLSALSFEEFDQFTRRLTALAPHMEVVSGLPPQVRRLQERGAPWSDMMIQLAMANYSRNDPRLDRGRYGVAKATYHLMLAHRKRLRLSREDWHLVMYEYIALSQRMAADYMNARGADNDANSPEEFLPVLTEALPFVDEYLEHCRGDAQIAKLRQNTQTMIDNARGRWRGSQQYLGAEEEPEQPGPSLVMQCGRCGSRLEDPTRPCDTCGFVNVPSPAALAAALLSGSVAGWLAWQQSASLGTGFRLAIAVAAGILAIAIVAPLATRFMSGWK